RGQGVTLHQPRDRPAVQQQPPPAPQREEAGEFRVSPARRRLDVLLVERGLFPSRQKAAAAIMAGLVYVEGRKAEKAGTMVPETASVEVRGQPSRYVSRGGVKLERALHAFGWFPEGAVALDIGASTGGFTDCLLQHGAKRVYAVDVGYGQLHWQLRNDPRVVVMERTNARDRKS